MNKHRPVVGTDSRPYTCNLYMASNHCCGAPGGRVADSDWLAF